MTDISDISDMSDCSNLSDIEDSIDSEELSDCPRLSDHDESIDESIDCSRISDSEDCSRLSDLEESVDCSRLSDNEESVDCSKLSDNDESIDCSRQSDSEELAEKLEKLTIFKETINNSRLLESVDSEGTIDYSRLSDSEDCPVLTETLDIFKDCLISEDPSCSLNNLDYKYDCELSSAEPEEPEIPPAEPATIYLGHIGIQGPEGPPGYPGPFSGDIFLNSGTLSSPSLSFSSDTSTGLYYSSDGNLKLVSSSNEILSIGPNGLAINNINSSLVTFYDGLKPVGDITLSNSTVSYNAFTGSHYCYFSNNQIPELCQLLESNDDHSFVSSGEIAYDAVLSIHKNSSKILGIYGGSNNMTTLNNFNTHLVNAVGNGQLFIVQGTESKVNFGDCLISSFTPGYAQVDDRSDPISYICGRVTEEIDWSTITDTIVGKKYKKTFVYFKCYILENQPSRNFTPSQDNLYNLGTPSLQWHNIYSKGLVTASDRNKKKDIKKEELGLDFIKTLNPVSYRWKNKIEKESKNQDKTGKVHHGLIAQEIDENFGGLSKGESYGLNYLEFIGPLIKSIQELNEKLERIRKD